MNRYAYLGPVILRIALGAVFIAHGLPKLLNAGKFAGFFGTIGIPAPHLAVPVIGLIEAGGGLLLLIGWGTRIVAGLLAANMLGAIVTAKRGKPFVGGWEFEFVLLAAAVSLFLSGPLGVGEATRRRT